MRIALIVAMTDAGVIGLNGDLPWRLPEDLRRFRRLTTGHPIIMGRVTHQSIGRLLPDRTNIVMTRAGQGDVAPGAVVCGDMDSAIAHAARSPGSDEAFVIGGAMIYRQFLPRADRIHLTLIHEPFEGDTRFPDWDRSAFRVAAEEACETPFPHTYVTLDRVEKQATSADSKEPRTQ